MHVLSFCLLRHPPQSHLAANAPPGCIVQLQDGLRPSGVRCFAEHYRPSQPSYGLLVSNHLSYLDIVLLWRDAALRVCLEAGGPLMADAGAAGGAGRHRLHRSAAAPRARQASLYAHSGVAGRRHRSLDLSGGAPVPTAPASCASIRSLFEPAAIRSAASVTAAAIEYDGRLPMQPKRTSAITETSASPRTCSRRCNCRRFVRRSTSARRLIVYADRKARRRFHARGSSAPRRFAASPQNGRSL